MAKHIIFIDWKTQHSKMLISKRFSFVNVDKLISNSMKESQGTETGIDKTIFREQNKVGGY